LSIVIHIRSESKQQKLLGDSCISS